MAFIRDLTFPVKEIISLSTNLQAMAYGIFGISLSGVEFLLEFTKEGKKVLLEAVAILEKRFGK